MLVETKKINKTEVNVVTSLDVAETFEKRHDHVLRDIELLKKDVPIFGEMFFESTIPDSYDRSRKIFYMNRDGFTLLVMGYTGEKAMKFKLAYIKQFNAMEELLKGKLIEREKGIVVRNAFTKAIQQSSENGRMHGHAYSSYTDVIYKSLFGKSAKQFRDELGITKKDNLRDYFAEEDLRKIQNAEMLVGSLMGYGWGYAEIKNFIMDKSLDKISANREVI